MKKADLDFKNLSFCYRNVNANIRYRFKDGKWDDGELSTSETMEIPIASTAIHYGQSCFEGLKVYETKSGDIAAFRPIENFKRFENSAKKLYMEPVPEKIFFDALNRVVNLNQEFIPPYGSYATLYVRPVLFGVTSRIGLQPADEYIFIMMVTPVGPYFKGGFDPVNMLVVEDLDRAAPFGVGDIKAAGNYAAGLRGSFLAKKEGFTDVIYLDAVRRKYIDESGPANFIAILKDGKYVTPDSTSILKSITNMSLMEIAKKDFGWEVEKRPLAIDEIENFAEAGCCGTAAVITPVGMIRYKEKDYYFHDNGKTAGPKITELYRRLSDIHWGEVEDTHNWMYKIELD